MYDDIKELKLTRRGKVLIVTIDNAPMNTMTPRMHTELSILFGIINRDPDTAVVVLTGAGQKAFTAGGDIKTMADKAERGDTASIIPGQTEAKQILYGLLRLEKPLIGRINGHAMGLGSTLVAFCDISFMIENAKIADTHVNVGIVAGDGGALMWPLLIGFQKAKRYLFTGAAMTGKEAESIGLVTGACATFEELDDKVYALADQLAAGPSVAINGTKQAVNLLLLRQFNGIVEQQLSLEFESFHSEDHLEAARAFRDKRKPVFKGR